MSLVAISGNASGTGTLTIASPNTNSNYTLTLPENTGTLISTKSAGTVLQVVQATKTDTFSTSSGSYVDVTGLSVSITPTSLTSTILVLVNIGCLSAASTNVRMNLVRGSTSIYQGALSGTINRASINFDIPFNYGGSSASLAYIDSPSAISSTTYKMQMATNGSATGYLNRTERDQSGTSGDARTPSSIIVLEIAA